MYTPVPTQETCVSAWAAAAYSIKETGEAYNVVIDVATPTLFNDIDREAIGVVDQFLRLHGENPISTVANTIFPQSLYRLHGSPAFYDEYLRVFDQLGRAKSWGRYFERMVRERGTDGDGFRPLPDLIDKIRHQMEQEKCFKATHELSIYDPISDRNRWRGGPCLSFLSFKCCPDRGLLLTAVYRNHHYIARCLGNLIGLGRLLAFVANETDQVAGSLTCISTHAEIEAGSWGKTKAQNLIAKVHNHFARDMTTPVTALS